MKRSAARFLPTLLALVTVVLAGFTAAGVQRIISLDTSASSLAMVEEFRTSPSDPATNAALPEKIDKIALDLNSAAVERDLASRRLAMFGMAFFMSIGLLVISLLVAERNARNLLRLARSARRDADRTRAQLVEAVENINEGFVLYDSADRLVLCNRKFREAYKIVADLLSPGVTSEEILRAATQRGQFPMAGDKVEEWVANRMAQRRRFDPPFEQQLAGGRWHMVSDRATRDGGLVGIRTDITELKRREIELREARQRLEDQADRMRALAEEMQQAKAVLQDAIESINEGFCLYDVHDRLVMSNSRYLDMHDRIREQIAPGVAYGDITRAAILTGAMIVTDPVDAAIANRNRIRHDLEDSSVEEQFDNERWIRVSTRRMRNGGIVSVFADISEMKQREFALTSAHARLERQTQEMTGLADAAQRANRAKSDFLAMMSHEIRTPLNGVISALHLVREQNLAQSERHLISTARSGAQSLLAILNDILDMSKIEAGMLTLDQRSFGIHSLIENVVALCRLQAESKGLTFGASISPDLPDFVAGDADRIRQMALNYVTNAIKFTETGSVEIHVSPAGSSSDLVRFEVVDTGIGIPYAKQGQVFRDFVQLDQSIRRRHGGTGLGLAITRRLARLMGGNVGFTSETDRGSTFWFDVPLARAEAPVCEEPAEAIVRESREQAAIAAIGMNVLLAEDNDTNRYLATLLLERMGCAVVAVCNGAEAVEAATHTCFDAVLMDISMPVMDGLEATRRIRATGFAAPIIALSANTGAEFEIECRQAGMVGYLTKPIDLSALRHRLATIATEKSHGGPLGVDLASAEPDSLDRVFSDLGPVAFQRIVASCRNDINAELATLLEGWRNFPNTDGKDAMTRAAHKLVSLAATIGATELTRLSRLIEAGDISATDQDAFARVAQASLQTLSTRASQMTARAA